MMSEFILGNGLQKEQIKVDLYSIYS